MSNFAKPVNLELNNSGSWKRLGSFDAADEGQAELVMDAAEELIKTLHNSEDPKHCPTLRIVADRREGVDVVLLRWELQRRWYDAVSGASV